MKILTLLMLPFFLLFGLDAPKGKSVVVIFSSPSGLVETQEQNISVLLHPTDRTKGMAVIPIDYYAQTGESNATWISPAGKVILPLSIQDVAYPTETLSVDPSKVTPPPEALDRIASEKSEAEAIYSRFTPIRYWKEPFILPIESNTTSAYGSARTYNGVLKSYHGGVDFRARTPQPVYAANDGVVVLVKDRYYAGGTVIIDHGEGLYSCYFHLSRFDVAPGDLVKRGMPIALTGATGRITGPHLHFGMMVHGIQSDPIDLISQINALFESYSIFENTSIPLAKEL